jgi:hypothetical protein
MRTNTRVVLPLIVVLAACAHALAGGLTPPGAPGSTMKTLDEVEARIPVGPLTTPGSAVAVYRITQPGSYYLTGDVGGGAGLSGIEIDSNNVTLDLNGYTIQGTGSTSLHGVFVQNYRVSVSIRNGVITNWGRNGVYALTDGSEIHDLRVRDCGWWAIDVEDSYNPRIERCRIIGGGYAESTLGGGIRAEGIAAIAECNVFGVAGMGIQASSGTVRDCTVAFVTPDFIQAGIGIFGALVESCLVRDCSSVGISANNLARGCVSVNNGAAYSGPNIVDSY